MRFLLICGFLSTCLFAEDHKHAITAYQRELNISEEGKKGELLVRLAIVYQKDQELELAIQTFLNALDHVQKKETPCLKQADLDRYDEALAIYLKQKTDSPQETAALIREKFASALEKNPDNYGLGFLMAAAYANLQMYEDFFLCYYKAFQASQHHFLAHKIKAILYLKLFEMGRTPDDREAMRKKIEAHTSYALNAYPHDMSLYKLMIQFASEKDSQTENILRKIISENVSISRSDIPFYVQKAIEAKKFELAQQFIDKMREHYRHSRMLASMQQLVDKAKGIGNGN